MPRVIGATAGVWQSAKSQPSSRMESGTAIAAAALAETNGAASEARSPLSASNTRPPAHAPADVARSAVRNRMTAFMTVPSKLGVRKLARRRYGQSPTRCPAIDVRTDCMSRPCMNERAVMMAT